MHYLREIILANIIDIISSYLKMSGYLNYLFIKLME